MSKKDRINKDIDNLREKRKDTFAIVFALLSGLAILFYSIVTGEKPIYVLLVGVVGFIVLLYFTHQYKKIDYQINDRLDDLEKED